jgi:hypothetical protein
MWSRASSRITKEKEKENRKKKMVGRRKKVK